MPRLATVLEILIASPGEVAEERDIVNDIIHDWNAVHSRDTNIILQPIRWEANSYPELGDRPQAIINKQIVNNCDILVGIFWTRLGTPTGVDISGSVEEIKHFIENKKPAMLYFSSKPINPENIDPHQYSSLKDFRDSLKQKGLFFSFNTIQDLKDKFISHLSSLINTFKKSSIYTGKEGQVATEAMTNVSSETCSKFRDIRVGNPEKKIFGEIRSNKRLPVYMLSPYSSMITHIIPHNYQSIHEPYELEKLTIQSHIDVYEKWKEFLSPSWRSHFDYRFNQDGLVLYYGGVKDSDPAYAYIQFYHNGIVEIVNEMVMGRVIHDHIIKGNEIENSMLTIVPQCIEFLELLGVKYPMEIFTTILGSLEYSVVVYNDQRPKNDMKLGIKDDYLDFPKQTLKTKGTLTEHLWKMLNKLARAGGWKESPNHSKNDMNLQH